MSSAATCPNDSLFCSGFEQRVRVPMPFRQVPYSGTFEYRGSEFTKIGEVMARNIFSGTQQRFASDLEVLAEKPRGHVDLSILSTAQARSVDVNVHAFGTSRAEFGRGEDFTERHYTETQRTQRTLKDSDWTKKDTDDLVTVKTVDLADADDGGVSEIPLKDYIAIAHAKAEESFEQRTPEDGWQSRMFGLARVLKAHPKMHKLHSDAALEIVSACLELDDEDALDYQVCWDAVRQPSGDPLRLAAAEAESSPFTPRKRRGALYGRFLSIAKALQRTMGDRAILLPCHRLAAVLDCTPKSVSNLRQFAVRDGYLQVIREHNRKSRTATRFIFTGDQHHEHA